MKTRDLRWATFRPALLFVAAGLCYAAESPIRLNSLGYLPGNGGLLAAVAMMATGWDNGPERADPGFPEEGWNIQWEGLRPMP